MQPRFAPLTPELWDDFTRLFGDVGACGGCWCMHWRLTAATFNANRGNGNKGLMHQLVQQQHPTGILAFDGTVAVGWCAIAPRKEYIRLTNARVLQPVDDAPVWSVTCFFIAKAYRNKGLSVALLNAAVAFAASQGATIVEGYPVDPQRGKQADVFVWTGLASAFLKSGFTEVLRRSDSRPIMRRTIQPADNTVA